MKRIALITLASLALFATAATAHQNGWGNNHMRGNGSMQRRGYSNGNCPMGGNMMGNRMGNRMGNQMGNRMMNTPQNSSDYSVNNNWRANPSYQGQAAASGETGK